MSRMTAAHSMTKMCETDVTPAVTGAGATGCLPG